MTESSVNVLLLRTAGTNCDKELAHAFTLAGANVTTVHINALLKDPGQLEKPQIVALPGGFSYGDDIASGKILANQLSHHLSVPLKQFIADGKMIFGVCNGFQVLVKCGLLPGPIMQLEASDTHPTTLTYNSHGRFEDRWVTIKSYSNLCKWLPAGRSMTVPIAHGEGRFVTRSPEILEHLKSNDQVVFRYVDAAGEPATVFPENPNGSTDSIAGICDITGRVLGLMPHPERIVDVLNAPAWTRGRSQIPEGLPLFQTAVEFVRQKQVVAV